MTELLDTPVGDFEWGPDGFAHRWRDRIVDTLAPIVPLVAIAIGAALLTLGIALGWSTATREPVDPPSDDSAIATGWSTWVADRDVPPGVD